MGLRLAVHGSKEEESKKLTLKLMEDDMGLVVCAVDKDGKPLKGGSIVRFTNNGMLVRIPGLPKDMGLQLNNKGQILQKKVDK